MVKDISFLGPIAVLARRFRGIQGCFCGGDSEFRR